MREELPRVLAFMFLCGALGLLEVAAAKVFMRLVREAREDLAVWRFRRKLRAHEAEIAARRDEQARRGDS